MNFPRKPQATAYFEEVAAVLAAVSHETVDLISSILYQAYQDGRRVFLFGNGGSAALASHFACDLGKGTVSPASSKRFRVLALTDNVPVLTAWANDSSYYDVFSEPLKNFVEPGDIAVAISASGNSGNVLRALEVARDSGAMTIGLGGFEGGKMKSLCDVALVVPSHNMQVIEDIHLSIAHCLFTILRARIESGALAGAVSQGS
ncbi:MAG TPA: SIS domain-containing protein [Terriglobales bacterium]|nr:SIS domain-containing protein [Terriglobales bacterium]